MKATGAFGKADETVTMCNCIGPQNGQPLCPCQMRGVIQRDGRWIATERDLGPVKPEPLKIPPTQGCICPPGSELTCQGISCPRRGHPNLLRG